MGNGITSVPNQYVQNNQVANDFDLKKEVGNFISNYVQACTDNKMQGMVTLLSLGFIAGGLTQPMPYDLRANVNFGVGLLGMSNLLTANLTEDDNVSQTCMKVGSIASILFFALAINNPFVPL